MVVSHRIINCSHLFRNIVNRKQLQGFIVESTPMWTQIRDYSFILYIDHLIVFVLNIDNTMSIQNNIIEYVFRDASDQYLYFIGTFQENQKCSSDEQDIIKCSQRCHTQAIRICLSNHVCNSRLFTENSPLLAAICSLQPLCLPTDNENLNYACT